MAGKRSADLVEQQLARYREMRDFQLTAEPKGKSSDKTPVKGLPYVIQKHAASHLHYDFRLGWNGVLKSWAVAKGPSYYPGDRRLAIQVEDHPLEYAGFEGIIPKGQYGGGTVMVWDFGTWQPEGDVDEDLKKGQIKFSIQGKKLKGRWMLVRMKPGGKYGNSGKPSWLLIKEHDKYEIGEGDKPITERLPNSALTKRSLDQIAAEHSHTWDSSAPAKKAVSKSAAPSKAAKTATKETASKKKERGAQLEAQIAPFKPEIPKTEKESLPDFVPPQLATLGDTPLQGEDWIHELKLDGYRMQARFERRSSGSTLRLLTRKGLDWTHRMPDVATALKQNLEAVGIRSALLDGELVALDEKGTSSFSMLQASFQEHKRYPLTYFIFDLLHLDGCNLRTLPLMERKRILEELCAAFSDQKPDQELDQEIVRYSEHIAASGAEVFRNACQLGAEGIISKRASAIYESGRGRAWVKLKCGLRQEFVVGAFTPPSDGSRGIGSLLLGYYEGDKLIYAGRSGTGFSQTTQKLLRTRLEKLRRDTSPFATPARQAGRDVMWVQPNLVAEIAFATWTTDGLVRQAAFKGLREDKAPREVVRENPNMPKKTTESAKEETVAEAPTPKTKTKTKASAVASKKAVGHAIEAPPVRLTHPDKILDGESKMTKRILADYYWAVAESMLPHIADRPLSLVRCPEGSTQPCFFQKHINHMLPKGIEAISVPNKKKPGAEDYITLSTPEALTGLAQIGVLEVHPWGSTNESLEKPDRIIFDLDPDEVIAWPVLRDAAQEVRARLKRVGLQSFLKTTGGKGLHIVAPIVPKHEWPDVKEFTRSIALDMERENPNLFLSRMTKAARKGKIYVDYQRNDRGATSVAPYSPRARAGAPVSMPLKWEELEGRTMPRFTVADFAEWQARLKADPWKKLLTLRQELKLRVASNAA